MAQGVEDIGLLYWHQFNPEYIQRNDDALTAATIKLVQYQILIKGTRLMVKRERERELVKFLPCAPGRIENHVCVLVEIKTEFHFQL